MKRLSIISLLLWIGMVAFATGKSKVMWLDCSANFQRFSYPDSIRYYVDKCHEAGITHLVLDIKDNTGEVLYPSKYTAQKRTGRISIVRILTLSIPLLRQPMPMGWLSLPG